jgi:hypothetical protein
MSSTLQLSLFAACLFVSADSDCSHERASCQEAAQRNEQSQCQGETCATVTGNIDARKLPAREGRPFLISLYPAPHGDRLATIVAGAGHTFTLPLQPPGSYVIVVSGSGNECSIRWKKKIKLHSGETKKIRPKPVIVSSVLCE